MEGSNALEQSPSQEENNGLKEGVDALKDLLAELDQTSRAHVLPTPGEKLTTS